MKGAVYDAAEGELAAMSLHHFSQAGKMLRPRFVRELGQCFELPPKVTLDWAVACEILHNATLVHDDLQDGDEIRRGVPSVWAKFGANQAINFGDFLLTLAPKPVLHASLPDSHKLRLASLMIQMSSAIAIGQAEEMRLSRLTDTKDLIPLYLACSAGKTSALFSGLAEGVALIADLPAARRRLLTQMFTPLGQLFQIQDDIVDLYGDKGRGEVGCDIKEGKVSFLIACHLTRSPGDFELVAEILHEPREKTTPAMIEAIKARFDDCGTLAYALSHVQTRLQTVEHALSAYGEPRLAALVETLLTMVFKPIAHLPEVAASIDLPGGARDGV